MTYLTHLAARVLNVPLLITPEYGSVVTTVLSDRIGVQPMASQEQLASYVRPASRSTMNRRTGIMTLPIVGGLVHRGGMMESLSGTNSYTSLHNSIADTLADDTVKGLLLDIDSGGGEAAGLAELVDWIPKASRQAGKPVWAIANTTAASAAYWLASSTDRLFAAPNSRVGSIGVYVQHVDMSKAVEKRGMVMSFIYAGDHKIDGNPFEPLADDVRANIQEGVNRLYGDFVSAVASNRKLDEKIVRDTQARVYGPEEAYDLGLVDGVGGLGSVLAAFGEHLNRPFVGYSSHGDQMSKELIYDQAALDRAKAEGVNAGKAEASADVAKLQAALDASASERKELLAAFTAISAGNVKAEVFVETLNEGGSVSLATKLSSKVLAPVASVSIIEGSPAKTRTQADVDKLMSAHAPNISDADASADDSDPKAKRMAEIAGSMAAFNKGRGFASRA